ncbi:MAG TPA: hypothetical protein VGD56_03705, partial [Gemmatirosa sp.]
PAAPAAPAEPTEVRLVGVDAQVVSPAWELELLVTGIVLVGLFQIPPWLQSQWLHWEPHLTLVGTVAARGLVQTLVAALYALIICFVVALALRGYWVALVGVNAVFPHGVRWEKQREYGRIQAEIMRPRVRPLPAFIGRVNDAASLVYATGFLLAAVAVVSLAFVAASVAVLSLLTAVLPLAAALVVFGVVGAAATLAVAGAGLVDMRGGDRLVAGGRSERFIRAVLRVNGALTPDVVRSLGAVLTSNVSKRVAYAAVALGFGGAYAATFASLRDGGALPGSSNYSYFAEGRRAAVVTADYYESLRGDPAPMGVPSIQSDVVTDPYVRLFVPYRPIQHNPAMRRACPTLQPLDDDDDGARGTAADLAVLACAAKLHAVALDGRPVAAPFRFFSNPRTERRGFLMLIPAANLAAGEHVLTLRPARREPAPGDTAPVRIPFWR